MTEEILNGIAYSWQTYTIFLVQKLGHIRNLEHKDEEQKRTFAIFVHSVWLFYIISDLVTCAEHCCPGREEGGGSQREKKKKKQEREGRWRRRCVCVPI